MTVGFVMLTHAELHRAAQVARLISRAGCPMVIHVDRRTPDDAFKRFIDGLNDCETITFAPRIDCDWGTWSLVDASRTASEIILKSRPDVTHVALISGSCIPIKPIEDLESFLTENPEKDFIESVTIGDVPWTQGGLSDERFTLSFPFAWKRQKLLFDLWVEIQRRLGHTRPVPNGIAPHMGSQWWCLTRKTLERILNDPEKSTYDRYFQRVWIPDESYFQTMVRHYDCSVISRSLTLSKFDFQGKPHVFYDDHLQLLRQSPAFFARKIWPEANRLYRAFLELNRPQNTTTRASVTQIDQTFAQAAIRRTQGRAGLAMSSRFPDEEFTNGLTAAPYAVFHGFSDVFQNFDSWVERTVGSRVHGHLFDPERVQFHGRQSGYAGALSDNPTLRDYDPEAFLRNLIWNTRGEHQSFMMSPRDDQGVCAMLAKDRLATISVITGAWALPLMRSGKPINDVRTEAALCQKREGEFLKLLRERRARANTSIWSLLEFLEHPAGPLQEIVDNLSGTESTYLTELPKTKPVRGLLEFLQNLRNAGMNPYLAGEASHISISQQSEDSNLRQIL